MVYAFKSKFYLYQTEDEVRSSLIQLSAYTVFLIVTTILGLSNPTNHIFFFRQSLEPLFLQQDDIETRPRSYEYLCTVDEWLGSIKNGFLKKVSVKVKENQSTEKESVKVDENYILGIPSLRQIRVLPEECLSHSVLKTNFNNCYPSYTHKKEDTTPIYKSTNYFPRKKYKSLPFFGNAETYKGPGYMINLSFNQDENLKTFQRIKENNWIDDGTRLLILELMVYNIDTLLFGTIKLSAEVLPTGGIIPKWRTDILPLYTIWSPRRPDILLTTIVFSLLVFYYTSVEVLELIDSGPKLYLTNFHNVIDMIMLGTAFVALALSVVLPFTTDSFLTEITKNPNALVNMDEIYFWHLTYVYAMAICVFLVWAKILRFIGFNKALIQFRTTLLKCIKDILVFTFMFLLVFMAFALCGTMIFGSTNENFKTFQNGLFSMVRMVLGDFQYEEIEFSNRVLCPIFYLLYVLCISFILLNMFLAIINNTYIGVKQEVNGSYSGLKDFFLGIYKKVAEKFKRQREDPKNLKSERSNLDNDQSMFEYGAGSFPNVGSGGRGSALSSLRSPLSRDMDQRGPPSVEDSLNADLIRLSERVELLENLVNLLSANINHAFERPEPKESSEDI